MKYKYKIVYSKLVKNHHLIFDYESNDVNSRDTHIMVFTLKNNEKILQMSYVQSYKGLKKLYMLKTKFRINNIKSVLDKYLKLQNNDVIKYLTRGKLIYFKCGKSILMGLIKRKKGVMPLREEKDIKIMLNFIN